MGIEEKQKKQRFLCNLERKQDMYNGLHKPYKA